MYQEAYELIPEPMEFYLVLGLFIGVEIHPEATWCLGNVFLALKVWGFRFPCDGGFYLSSFPQSWDDESDFSYSCQVCGTALACGALLAHEVDFWWSFLLIINLFHEVTIQASASS